MSVATPPLRIVFLDYLRIFAFASVLVGHKFYDDLAAIARDPGVHATPRFLIDLVLPFVYGGGAGVMVFFFVSGYIITHVLQTEATMEFIVKRCFRIYPLYVVAVLVECLLRVADGHPIHGWTLLAQLLLVGDLFGTPYSLAGVEWTLRIEIAFYAFMALLNALGWVKGWTHLMVAAFVAAIVAVRLAAPVPDSGFWVGYFSLYAPFILLGALAYLFEARRIGLGILLAVGALVYAHYYSLLAIHQPRWLGFHFAALALVLFAAVWRLRSSLPLTPLVLFLSDLTYSVYLFHLWGLDRLQRWVAPLPLSPAAERALALAQLFAFC